MSLIKELEKELARNCRLNNWDLGFQAAIDIVKQHSDWISVDERLPSVSGHYHCCFLSGDYWHQHVDFFDTATKKFSDDDGVRWWYDLPQLPIEVQNG